MSEDELHWEAVTRLKTEIEGVGKALDQELGKAETPRDRLLALQHAARDAMACKPSHRGVASELHESIEDYLRRCEQELSEGVLDADRWDFSQPAGKEGRVLLQYTPYGGTLNREGEKVFGRAQYAEEQLSKLVERLQKAHVTYEENTLIVVGMIPGETQWYFRSPKVSDADRPEYEAELEKLRGAWLAVSEALLETLIEAFFSINRSLEGFVGEQLGEHPRKDYLTRKYLIEARKLNADAERADQGKSIVALKTAWDAYQRTLKEAAIILKRLRD